MSIRTQRIPGLRLGLGTFINNDVDGKRKVIYFGTVSATATDYDIAFTQGQTKMATITMVLVNYSQLATSAGSASVDWKVGTISGGTVTVRRFGNANAAAFHTHDHACQLHFWMAGSPDPNRIVV